MCCVLRLALFSLNAMRLACHWLCIVCGVIRVLSVVGCALCAVCCVLWVAGCGLRAVCDERCVVCCVRCVCCVYEV